MAISTIIDVFLLHYVNDNVFFGLLTRLTFYCICYYLFIISCSKLYLSVVYRCCHCWRHSYSTHLLVVGLTFLFDTKFTFTAYLVPSEHFLFHYVFVAVFMPCGAIPFPWYSNRCWLFLLGVLACYSVIIWLVLFLDWRVYINLPRAVPIVVCYSLCMFGCVWRYSIGKWHIY